jgi:hypothetical protein
LYAEDEITKPELILLGKSFEIFSFHLEYFHAVSVEVHE